MTPAPIKILAIPATNNHHSINRQLLGYVATVLETESSTDVEIEFLDLNDFDLPIYSPQLEEQGIPEPAHRFYDKIGAADAVIVSFAEYNGSFTPVWKNTYDWASRIDMKVYQGKKVIMLAASPGPRGGAGVLGSATMSAPHFGADLVGSMGIPSFYQNFDSETGVISDTDLDAQLRQILDQLVTASDGPGREAAQQ